MSAVLDKIDAAVGKIIYGAMTIEVVEVTPAMATEWLRFNNGNRAFDEKKGRAYARLMAIGKWAFSDTPIGFDAEGTLIQGQHRLWAVAFSGVTVTFLVVHGLSDREKLILDSGKPRRPSDVLTMYGEKNASRLASTIAFLWKHEQGKDTTLRSYDTKPTAADTLQWLADHPQVRESVVAAGTVCKIVSYTSYAAAHYLTSREDPTDAMRFTELLRSGEGLFDGDPILALRRFAEYSRGLTHGNVKPVAYAAIIIKAMNAWREGQPVLKLRWRQGGANAEPFPKIWRAP